MRRTFLLRMRACTACASAVWHPCARSGFQEQPGMFVRFHALAALSSPRHPPTWVQGDGTSVCKAPLLSIFKSKWVQRQGG